MRFIAALLLVCAVVSPCLGQAYQPRTKAEIEEMKEKAKREIKETLESFASQALQAELPPSPDIRRVQASEIRKRSRQGNPTRDTIRLAMAAVVMWPHNTEAAAWIIQSSEQAFNLGVALWRADYAAPIEALYRERARSGGGNVPAIEWQEGLAELLAESGRYQEAEEIVTNALTIRGESRSPYLTVLAAVIERFNGDPKPLDNLLADCKPPDYYESGDEFCREVASTIACRTIDLWLANERRAPIRLLLDLDRDYATRLYDLQTIAHRDPAIAESELLRIVHDQQAPDAARHDAAMYLSNIAKFGSHAREAIAWTDCALRFRGVKMSPFSKDAWRQLVAYAKSPRVASKHCKDDPEEAECVSAELSNRVFDAMHDDEWAVARQSAEQLALWTLDHRLEVFSFAQTMMLLGQSQWDSGLKDEGRRTLEFALLLDPRIATGEEGDKLTHLGIVAAHETATPWESPTELAAPLPQVCPE